MNMKKLLPIIIAVVAVIIVAVVAVVLITGNNTPADDNNDIPNGDANNTPAEKTYTLSLVADDGLKTVSKGGATVIGLALVYDADGKIVAARFDSVQPKFALNAEKTDMVAVNRVDTKVELGDEYTGMSDSWKDEAAAFEAFLVGKTAAEIAALNFVIDGADAGLVAGCTMKSSMPVFQTLIAKAFAYERNITFKTTEAVTLGLAIDAKVSGTVAEGGKINAEFAAVAVAGGKVVASMIDSAEATYTLEITNGTDKNGNPTTSLSVTLNKYAGTKNEQGDAYGSMPSGTWYAQAQAFANTAVGKTVAELADLSTDKIEGSCSIYTGGYKAAIVRAAGYVR